MLIMGSDPKGFEEREAGMGVIGGMFKELARLGVSRAAAFFYAVAVGVVANVVIAHFSPHDTGAPVQVSAPATALVTPPNVPPAGAVTKPITGAPIATAIIQTKPEPKPAPPAPVTASAPVVTPAHPLPPVAAIAPAPTAPTPDPSVAGTLPSAASLTPPPLKPAAVTLAPAPADTAAANPADTAPAKPADAPPPALAPITSEIAVAPPPGASPPSSPVSLLPTPSSQAPVETAVLPSPDAPPKKPGPGAGGLY